MQILQSGAPKSGNFWLYTIIQEVLRRTGLNITSYIENQSIYNLAKEWKLNFPGQSRIDVLEITDLQYKYRISSIFNMPIDDIELYVKSSPHVWTHSPVCKRSDELFNLFDKKIYIIRDPRERAISASKYFCSDYMLKYFPQEETIPSNFLKKNFDMLMQEWVWHVYDHLRYSAVYDIHIVFFENLLLDFAGELEKMLDYLDIGLSVTAKSKLEEAVSFTNMKKVNPDHLKKGKAGYWAEHLTDQQVERTNIIAAPLLEFLNYPIERRDKRLPVFNIEGLEILKEKILQSQEKL